MSQSAYLLLGLTAIVAALVGVLVFAVLHFGAAARDAARRLHAEGAETAFMATALQDAMAKVREQERAMKERAEASERLSDEIVASLTSGLLVVDVDRSVRTLNPAGARLLGLSTEAAGSLSELLADAAPLADAIDECLATRRPIVRRALELPSTRSGAASRAQPAAGRLGVTVSPMFDDAGTLQGAICLFTDLSPIVELEEQLRLRDSLARVGEMTAGIAHEFRNGLATIHGYSRLLDLDELPHAYRAYVEGIRQETGALGQIIERFLEFARPAQLIVAPVDLGALAERAAEEVRGEAKSRGGDVQVCGLFATIEGDEVLLRQAVSNLCRNALEACIERGVAPNITLEGRVDETHGMASLTVSDNGPGIDAALRDQIFRPFFTTKPKGTGLGLALVQKIVVTHNGRVVVGRAPGGGAAMQLVLPLRARAGMPDLLQ